MQQGTQVVNWQLVFTKQAMRDAKKLAKAGLRSKAEFLLDILSKDPFQQPPPFER
jgi:Txe/YoeB family toxin of Txe-Axe toxin-antitoxin module